MKNYLDLLQRVLNEGVAKNDRTNTGTLSLFGAMLRFDIQTYFPLLTTKKVHLKSIIHELIWFLNGQTNVAYLRENGVTIWDEWATDDGELGPIYGKQWRDCGGCDQINQALKLIREDPNSRRIVVSAWNVAELPQMALHPCHVIFQFYVANGRLSCHLYQRSADIFLGLPFNIASYALLTMMMAQQSDLLPGEFIWSGGDVHLYSNHIQQAKLQLQRAPLPLPQMQITKAAAIDKYQYTDFILQNYCHHPAISAPIAV